MFNVYRDIFLYSVHGSAVIEQPRGIFFFNSNSNSLETYM